MDTSSKISLGLNTSYLLENPHEALTANNHSNLVSVPLKMGPRRKIIS